MSEGPPRSEAALGILLIGALLLALMSMTEITNPQPDLRASTFVNDRAGLRALALLLEELGVEVETAYEPLGRDAPVDRTFVLAAPTDPVLDDELTEMLEWAARGGRLVVIDEPSAPPMHMIYASELLLALGFKAHPVPEDALGDGRQFASLHPDLGHDDLKLEWKPRSLITAVDPDELEPHERRPDPRAGPPEALVTVGPVPVVHRVRLGEGSVVLIPDTMGLRNDRLGVGDHALLAAELIAGPDRAGATVVFDEFHHGFTPEGQKGGVAAAMAQLLVTTWPGRALLVLLAAAAVVVFGRTFRFGAPLPEPRSRRRALTEHTAALGQVYSTARARVAALHLIAAGVRRRVGPRVGLSHRMRPEEFDRRLGNCRAPGAAELAQALATAHSAEGRSDGELLTAATGLARAKWRFIHGRS